jgi:hypothetical protein
LFTLSTVPDDTKQERSDKERRADDNRTSAEMEADDPVHKALGDFGWWQFWITLALSMLKFPIAWHQLAIIFLAARTPFQCDIDDATALPNVTDTRCTSRDPITMDVVPCRRFAYDRSVFQETIITEVCAFPSLGLIRGTGARGLGLQCAFQQTEAYLDLHPGGHLKFFL